MVHVSAYMGKKYLKLPEHTGIRGRVGRGSLSPTLLTHKPEPFWGEELSAAAVGSSQHKIPPRKLIKRKPEECL